MSLKKFFTIATIGAVTLGSAVGIGIAVKHSTTSDWHRDSRSWGSKSDKSHLHVFSDSDAKSGKGDFVIFSVDSVDCSGVRDELEKLSWEEFKKIMDANIVKKDWGQKNIWTIADTLNWTGNFMVHNYLVTATTKDDMTVFSISNAKYFYDGDWKYDSKLEVWVSNQWP